MLIDLLRPVLSPILLRLPQPDLRVNRLSVPFATPIEDFSGITIAHISDLHVGEGDWLPRQAEKAAAEVSHGEPHLVVNTGDFIRHQPPTERVVDFARRFTVPGVPHLAVLGNHDYYAGDDHVRALVDGLELAGIRVLQNQVIAVEVNGETLTVGGLTFGAAGFDEALQRLIAGRRPRLCLLHEPDIAELLPPASLELVLAGHTHGGQIAVPLLTPLVVRRFSRSRYVAGLYQVKDNPVYVNAGLGFTGLPLRAGAAPEVAMIRLGL